MTTQTTQPALDRTDERLTGDAGARGLVRSSIRNIRDGDLGFLPVIIGLVIIAVIFQILNPVFLSSANLVNLALDSAAVGVISLGIVFVLLVGEIDLSVGSLSGFSAAIMAVLFVRHGVNLGLAVLIACLVACAIGLLYGVLLTKFGMPSFVASLAGLLAFLGLQLAILGSQGSINLPYDSGLVQFAQLAFLPAPVSYALAAVFALGFLLSRLDRRRRRARANLSTTPLSLLVVGTVLLLLALEFAFWYLNQARGVGWMVITFLVMVLVANYAITRTKWGRSLLAVGGNREAARRSGINVNGIYWSAFVLTALLACVGGLLSAGRLASANLSSGTGDVNLNAIAAAVIGGTSLFGGRGSAFSALLGTLVIGAIASGLTLLNLESSWRFVITGVVLAVAVGIDSLARRSRASHGRA
ncbi:simple sugar transport system permease protein/D-xylose transport system permease protein [Friedmanniella endophytica]|uniref:Xylose transport system permease protein XylH n=1 Tax=Microlunatus kandeliicorticis TaxID=1759536 RepID=A0A7W3P4I6_9ACTN|nr:sugar ABC transporter permease [Microlunatus kandeliicorticis]MBA8792958.1 simple sugar transport system permease protein/D-xylose transport system permease protein [Microlunatus kandeliicorticis]